MIQTRDLWIAAFMINEGEKLVKFEVISRGKAKFYFNITDERYNELKLKFFQHDLSKIKQTMEELKDLAY
jgi:5,10-methylene-tetrahydrofolate dehydrogenase/methenyl tetrahydrofolate cyclohydrolase